MKKPTKITCTLRAQCYNTFFTILSHWQWWLDSNPGTWDQ
jgi:hypothetical protein